MNLTFTTAAWINLFICIPISIFFILDGLTHLYVSNPKILKKLKASGKSVDPVQERAAGKAKVVIGILTWIGAVALLIGASLF